MDNLFERAMQRLPDVREWIQETLRRCERHAQPVATLGLARLPLYFPAGFLNFAKVVVVDDIPTIPMSTLGLPEFGAFERMEPSAITYDDTYFIRKSCREMESLHCHELIHVLQWQHLGFDRFVVTYAAGLVLHGYEENPLEVQARRHEKRFHEQEPPYDAAEQVRNELPAIARELSPSNM